jgi:hypothetical protein
MEEAPPTRKSAPFTMMKKPIINRISSNSIDQVKV